MRILFVILAVLLIVPGWSGADRLPLYRDAALRIVARPVALYPGDPARRWIGPLTYLGGVALSADDPSFGGFSAMHVAGDQFTLLSDGGGIVRFRMGADWRPHATHAADLPDGPGTGWEKRDRDSESMVVQGDGRILIGFERANAIWRYAPGFARAEASVRPRAMRRWSANGGAEAMAALPDGSVAVFSEGNADRRRPGFAALRFLGDPTRAGVRWHGFRYVAPPGFSVTDAVATADGRLLVLVRRFGLPQLFTARLQVADVAAIRPGAVVTGRTIAAFEGDVIHDNLEALALTREGARTILWIASDDNEAWWQRSLLLKFALD